MRRDGDDYGATMAARVAGRARARVAARRLHRAPAGPWRARHRLLTRLADLTITDDQAKAATRRPAGHGAALGLDAASRVLLLGI
ncbi:hypothetical protein [Nonomuraea sp. 10N515B]|uniref:hypothetical protein n=1 Tax=Nonomuraea sp. 10N515B TaxID=3457422 RepID=UPI003FCE933D